MMTARTGLSGGAGFRLFRIFIFLITGAVWPPSSAALHRPGAVGVAMAGPVTAPSPPPLALTGESGLQPFTNPAGWMGSMGPPPTQAYTREELATFLDRTEPVFHSLLDAVADRAPSLYHREALLPLARLATWTDSEAWVRPLDEWPGEARETDAAPGGNDDEKDKPCTTPKSLND